MATASKLFHAAAATALLFTILAGISSCSDNGHDGSAEEFGTWVSGFTGGRISSSSSIKVVLTTPAAEGVDAAKAISFSPSIPGSAKWSQDRTELVFTPNEGALTQGRKYKASLHLKKITAGAEPKNFKFHFTVARKYVSLVPVGVTISNPDRSSAKAEFSLVLSEDVKVTAGMIQPSEGKVSVEGTTVTVSDIARTTADRTLKVTADLSALGFQQKAEAELTIPSLDTLKVISTRRIGGSSPYVEVRFSEPFAKGIDLSGLVSLSGTRGYWTDVKDNVVKLYYEQMSDNTVTLDVDEAFCRAYEETFPYEDITPEVKILTQGSILSNPKDLHITLSSKNLRALEIKVTKVHENNILTYLQDGRIGTEYGNLKKNGTIVFHRMVALDKDLDLTKWNDTELDLSGIIKDEPGAIYRVKIFFDKDCYIYSPESQDEQLSEVGNGSLYEDEMAQWEDPYTSEWELDNRYDWYNWIWEDRNDPTKATFYMDNSKYPSIEIISSSIGIIAKSAGTGKLWVAVTDINRGTAILGADVTAYNYQKQEIGKGVTDANGLVTIKTGDAKPFILTASKAGSTGYLRVLEGEENPTTKFDTYGTALQKGMKGFIFGERGVWRPGDTVHLFLVVEDRQNSLPDGHPAKLELFTPSGQSYTTMTSTCKDGFFRFDVATDATAPTGTWNAIFTVGGSTFSKSVRIETIKANRLKVDMKLGSGMLQAGKQAALTISSNWLTGPVASGLKTRTKLTLNSRACGFSKCPGYTFSNPAAWFYGQELTLSEKTLDANGFMQDKVKMPSAQNAPGMLTADIVCRVFEQGGDASIYSETRRFSPYGTYVGIDIEDSYETDKSLRFPVVTVDPEGNAAGAIELKYRIWKMDWSWWWENGESNLASYVNGTMASPVAEGTLTTDSEGKAEIPFRIDYPEWGRYFIYVQDPKGKHATGGTTFIDWPSWRGQSNMKDPSSLTMLSFSMDKTEYKVGETATVYVPAAMNGRALVSVENSTGVISSKWTATNDSTSTKFTFSVTKDMCPNAYVDITLLRPNDGKMEGQPLRLYGIQPFTVTSEDTHLNPQIEMADVIAPEKEFTVKVSEKNGKSMTYVLAIVDEGLLDITNYRTPDIWSAMNEREAFNVRTWDLFDDVIGAYSGEFSRIMSIGGDSGIDESKQKTNRFNPVVKVLGPFTVQGGKDEQKVQLPMYVGSVRVMVVAGKGGAYGKADKTVTVKSPLMVLPTLPRQLKLGEKVTMPVNVFAMDETVKDVEVSISVEGPVSIKGSEAKTISFNETGDKMVHFQLETDGVTDGQATVAVMAKSGDNIARDTISIAVVPASDPVTTVEYRMVEKGDTARFTWTPFDPGRYDSMTLHRTSFPMIDVDALSRYMMDYSYSCTEQLSSRLLTCLSLGRGKDMVPGMLKELLKRQDNSGAFSYWAGGSYEYTWATTMAGHAMLEARAQGYEVPESALRSWTRLQKTRARQYVHDTRYNLSDLNQAYRLYTLALAGDPDIASMNRLREQRTMSVQACWRLAAAYALAGRNTTAAQMVAGCGTDFEDCQDDWNGGHTFWSRQRDMAMIMEAMLLCGEKDRAALMAIETADRFNRQSWHSTQDAAFMACAIGRFMGATEQKLDRTETVNPTKGELEAVNDFDGAVFMSLATTKVAGPDEKTEASGNGMKLALGWYSMDGKAVDPRYLRQGQDIDIVIEVTNNSGMKLEDMALTCPVPSGWEILSVNSHFNATSDTRDDKAIIYFGIEPGVTREFTVRCQISYEGTFQMAPVKVEGMYDGLYRCNSESMKVNVAR